MGELAGHLFGRLLELGPVQAALWWGIYSAAAAFAWVRLADQHCRQIGDRMFAWWLWHWWTGGPLETSRADTGSAARRAALAVARAAGTVGGASAAFVAAGGQVADVPLAGPAVAAGVTGWTWLVVRVAVDRAHYRQWVRPLHRALHKLALWDEDQPARSYLTVPRELAEGGEGVFVYASPAFAWKDGDCQAIENAVIQKLDLGDVNVKRVPRGKHGYFRFWPKQPMPTLVKFADPAIREIVDGLKESEVLFGLGRNNAPVTLDIDTDSPHLLLSAGTGGGKSWTLHMLSAQLMAHGAQLAVLDHKRHSHRWARHLEGDGIVNYAVEMEDIHTSLVSLGAEAERRNMLWDNVDIDDKGAPTYPRLIVICEELNATMHQLKAYWRTIRPKGNTDASGPAVAALRNILYMGRAVKVHIFAVAQMAIANDLGGGAARENFDTRMFNTRWSKNNWEMLAPQVPYQSATGRQGRGFVVRGDRAIETQYVMMTPHEARALVMEHRDLRVRPTGDVAVPADSFPLGDEPRHVAVPRQPSGGVAPVSLWTASADKGRGILALKYDALRKAAERDRRSGTFPEPAGNRGDTPLYDPRDLQRWENLRSPAGGSGTPSTHVQGDVIALPSRMSEANAETEGLEVESTRGA